MSRERRTLEPYTVDPSLKSALRGATVWLDDECCAADSSLTIDDGSFGRREAWLTWASEEAFDDFKSRLTNGAYDTGIHPQWMRLVVVARTGSLKVAEKLIDVGLDDLDNLPRTVRLDRHPPDGRRFVFRTGHHGAIVDAYVALSPHWTPDSPVERRLPKRPATWLARATFRLDARHTAALFHPRALDDAKREELGLPPGTVRYIDLRGQDLLQPIEGTPDVDVWVDEEVLAAVSASHTSAPALLFQRQLMLDFVASVVFEYSRQVHATAPASVDDSEDDFRASLIGKVVDLVLRGDTASGADNERRARALQQCQSSPAKVVARAEDALGLREGIGKALRVIA